jgi:tetratricopeptide (TPR) repeat protein
MMRLQLIAFAAVLIAPVCLAAEDADWNRESDAGIAAFHAGRQEAERSLAACLKLAENFELTDPRRAQSINNLAAVYYQQGKYREAEPLFEKAAELHEKLKDEQALYAALNNLGTLYVVLSRFESAQTVLERSLKISEHRFGAESAQAAQVLVNLSAASEAIGNYMLRRALNLRERFARRTSRYCHHSGMSGDGVEPAKEVRRSQRPDRPPDRDAAKDLSQGAPAACGRVEPSRQSGARDPGSWRRKDTAAGAGDASQALSSRKP